MQALAQRARGSAVPRRAQRKLHICNAASVAQKSVSGTMAELKAQSK
jgi:hypothetical protein